MALSRSEAAAKVMVALDKPDEASALRLADQLQGSGCWAKVGMELFYAAGPGIIGELKARGFRVFLDVKMHDIPNTVRGGSRSIARLGADMFNVHAAGGAAMMSAAMQGVQDAIDAGDASVSAQPLVIAVTQLTSTSRETMNDEIGIPGTVEDAVVHYARLAKQAGLNGVVASPLEVEAIKTACGDEFLTVTPGIRPRGADIGDQTRITTPLDAVRLGTDYLVIGRPITGASDPAEAYQSILEEMTL
ncbi:orotidine-5'-phosphate decarboxylase [Cohnella lubricantis]|uniref:Orotidine 5'-phosphate decarboxylase n=1 Tax=Cohnella lubricantis TaxID=2163172 RepID=A0A841TDH7_9BACL|nr:orotidine-5'-phosphate decarboxylase [Cohnella lubricantis]MBB6677290.1 orotidine-5'-phosphate decarboxylase [Cohnella lubricantis]MBP2116898.1 orotidine-5'-phosphate decarboxylase [Cohnella lubricantis]